MEIVNLPAGFGSITNKEIETGVQSLAFHFTGVSAASLINGLQNIRQIMSDVIGGAEMNIQKQDGSDTQSLIQSLKIVDLAEICTHNDGVISIRRIADNVTIDFTIEVSTGGALQMNDNGKLMFAINNVPATSELIIDAIDHALATKAYIKYESKYVNANTSKDFLIDAAYAVALPTNGVKALELTYENGKNVKLSDREIQQILRDSQDMIFTVNGVLTLGSYSWSVLSVEHVQSMRLTLDSSANFYLLKNQTL